MSIKSCCAAIAVMSALAAPAAFADEVLPGSDGFTKWGQEGDWTVYVDVGRKSCLIERVDENENVMQMGLTKDHTFGYVGVFTKADVGLTSGKEKIRLSLDGNLYEGELVKTKHLSDGYVGGYVISKNLEFLSDLEKKHEMVVMPKHENAFTVSLDGTHKAIEAAIKCNEEQAG